MIAAFWSSVGSSMGTTTNLACIGGFYAMRFNRRVMLFENHVPERSGLKTALFPKREQLLPVLREEPYYYDHHGMEQLMKLLKAGYEPESIDQIAVPVRNGGLRYLPLSEHMSPDVYEYELNLVAERLLWELDRRNDLVLVDTQASGNLTTKTILDRADLVVVNLRQEPGQIEEFQENYAGLLGKAVYLLGYYQEESIYNRVNLSRIYGIPEERIWVMPEYPLLPYLYDQGGIPDFLHKNLWTASGEKNFILIRELRRASAVLSSYVKEGVPV